MSITRKRAGRKSWETRQQFAANLAAAASMIAKTEFKYSVAQTKEMVIERSWSGKTEVITFSMAYSELSMWLDKSFANVSELGFSDCLVEIFKSGASVYTGKASYKLWTKI